MLVKYGVPLDGLKEKLSPLPPLALNETDGLPALLTVRLYEDDLDRPVGCLFEPTLTGLENEIRVKINL